jgi:OmpA-OmpF porin, OOP family
MARGFKVPFIGSLLIMIVFSCVAFAQVQEGSFSITPQFGVYRFEKEQEFENGFHMGIGGGYNFTQHVGTELSFNYIRTPSKSSRADVEGYLYRWDFVYHFLPDNKIVPYLAGGLGGLALDPAATPKSPAYFLVNYGGGVKAFLKENIALRGDIRHIIPFNKVRNNVMLTFGIDFLFGGGEKAPAPAPTPKPEPKPEPVVAPAPPPDSDGDGVIDSNDACPNTPKGVKVDSKGCPLDTDGDGVYDYLDKCPDTPKGVKVNSSGCPLDTDGDGVYDYLDKCPDTPQGVKVNSSGCPLDTDGDGVYDYLDKCPDTPKDLKVNTDGCSILMKKQVAINLDIQFDTDKAVIKPEYNGRLKEVADFMTTYPQTTTVIEGHTDSVGKSAYNQKLSQKRSDAVRAYLINNFNLSADRLTAKGYGEEKPVASNDTEEGRSQNRRIQAVFNAETEYYEKR